MAHIHDCPHLFKTLTMKKSILTTALLVVCVLFSCSKNDDAVTPPDNHLTVQIENNSEYDFKMFQIYAITGTTRDDISKDTTSNTRKVYKLGALASGKKGVAKIDPKFKSLVMVFTYNNPILGNKDYNALITSIGDGTNTVPYILKGKTIDIKLDEKMKFNLL